MKLQSPGEFRIFTIPNLVTSLRVLCLPGFVIPFLEGGKVGYSVAIAFAIFFEVTDWLDGWLARKMDQTSNVGKLLDPLADTLTRFTIFLTFMYAHLIPLWMVICLFFRDMIVAYVRVAAAANNYIMSARSSGKLKAIVQGIGIFVVLSVMLLSEFEGFSSIKDAAIAWWTMFLVTLVTLYSLVDYVWGLAKLRRQVKRNGTAE